MGPKRVTRRTGRNPVPSPVAGQFIITEYHQRTLDSFSLANNQENANQSEYRAKNTELELLRKVPSG